MEKKKKNGKRFIIPATYFHSAEPEVLEKRLDHEKPSATTTQVTSSDETTSNVSEVSTATVTEKATKPAPKIKLKNLDKKVSGLSLSSIKAKKEHELKKQDVVVDEENLPSDPFEESTLQEYWKKYVLKIDKEGKKLLASSLSSDIPKLKEDFTISIELPNDTMKKEVERDQYPLMTYLKKKLNNYDIKLHIVVNEVAAKQYAFTPQEKYQKLVEKNPHVETLRKSFDLDF